MIQVLIDADNLTPARLHALLRALPLDESESLAAGNRSALAEVDWPGQVALRAVEGWQQADAVLAAHYRPGTHPLVLASGDGDFAHLARGHGGPVLVVSGRPAQRLRAAATVIDPVHDGIDALRHWFDAVLDSQMG